MHLGGITIPANIDGRGRYLYQQPVLRTNGDGEAVIATYATVTWTFPYLSMSDYTWLRDTLLLGQATRLFTSASLKDDRGTDTTFTSAIGLRPTYEYAQNGYVENVTWKIERIR